MMFLATIDPGRGGPDRRRPRAWRRRSRSAWPATAAESPKADPTRAGPVDGGCRRRRPGSVRRSAARRRGRAAGERPVPRRRRAGERHALLARRPDPPHGQPRLPPAPLGDDDRPTAPRVLGRSSRLGLDPVAVAFSPDGKQIALYGSHRTEGDEPGFDPVRLLVDAATGKEVRRLPVADRDSDLALAFTPDGKSLISLGYERRLSHRGDRLGRGAPPAEIPPRRHGLAGPLAGRQGRGHLDRPQYPEALPVGLAGRRRAAGGRRCRGSGSAGWPSHPDGKACSPAAISSRSSASGTWRRATCGTRSTCATTSARPAWPSPPTARRSRSAIRATGGARISSGGVLLLERGTGKLVRELPTPGVPANHVIFSPDGRWLAAVGGVGVHVWDWRSGEEVAAGVRRSSESDRCRSRRRPGG